VAIRQRAAIAGMTIAALVGVSVIAPASPAAAYQQTGTFGPDGTATVPSGVAVSITGSGDVALGSAVAAPPAATTSPVGAANAPAIGVSVSDDASIDSSYHQVGTLTVGFSRPVRDPRLHLFDLGSAGFATRLVLTSPGLALVPRAGWNGWTVSSTQAAPSAVAVTATSSCGPVPSGSPRGCGSIEVLGLTNSVTFRVDAARTTITGASTATSDSFDVNATLDEDLANAAASYGGAAHAISDLSIGAGVTADNPDAMAGSIPAIQTSDTNDAAMTFPPLSTSSAGQPYAITVPVAGVSAPATLAGWIDINDNGHFDPAERATATVPTGATSATLRWSKVPTVVPGPDRPVRLRLGYNSAQVASPTGYADSGEVEDHTVTIAGTGARTASCAGTTYVRAGSALETVDLATGTLTATGDLDGPTGGLAWNPQDALLYGAAASGLSAIDPATGATLSTFTPSGFPSGHISGGTVDDAGMFYAIVLNSNTLVAVNLNPSSPDYRTATRTTFAGAAVSSGDIALNPADGMLYLIDPTTDDLSRIDPSTGARTQLGRVAGASGTAEVFDAIGNLYDIGSDGTITQVDLTGPRAAAHRVVAPSAQAVSNTDAITDAAGCLSADDFGDAPSSYGTPYNGVLKGLALGSDVDAEPGPVADTGGTFDGLGDDRGDGRDDEDALTAFPSVAVDSPSFSVTVPVVNQTGSDATLAGWIDADGDGTFEASERATVAVPAGATSATLSWTGLSGLTVGTTYARLRLDAGTVADPSPTGAGPAGEIEDYPVRVHKVPAITSPVAGALLAGRTPVISGTAEPGGALSVADGATTVCSTTVTPAGTWACTPIGALADGSHTFTPTNLAADGDRQVGSPVTVTIDGTPPSTPAITDPAANAWSSTARPVISGTGETSASIAVSSGGDTVCTTTVAAGAWSCTPLTPLPAGSDALTATAKDAAGNTSTSPTVIVNVDTTPPPAPVIASPADGATVGGEAVPLISGTGEPSDTITVADGSGSAVCVATVTTGGTWSCTATAAIPDGPVTLTPTATDLAGNSTPGNSTRLTIDTTAPPAAVITSPRSGAAINTTTPTITGTGEPGDVVSVRAGDTLLCSAAVAAGGTWTCVTGTALPAGSSSLVPTQVDGGGNTTAGTAVTILVDTTPPPAPAVVAPASGAFVNSRTPVFSGSGEAGDTIEVSRSETSAVICSGVVASAGTWSCVPSIALPSGSVTFIATATDQAGNTAASTTRSFTVDTTPPPAAVITTPASGSITNNPRFLIDGTGEVGDTVDVTDGTGANVCTVTVAATGAWSCTPAASFADGQVTLTPTATDLAGNVTPGAASIIRIDTTPPPPPTVSSPASGAYLASHTPTVAGTGEPDDTITVADSHGDAVCSTIVEAAPAGAARGAWKCTSGRALAEGTWSLIATETDAAGNSTAGAPAKFVIDTTPPGAPQIVTPANGSVTNDRQITISGAGDGGSLVTVRAGAVLVCTSTVTADGEWSCKSGAPESDGTVTLVAIATDLAGNTTAGPSTSYTIDGTPPPAATIDSPVAGTTIFTDTPVISGHGEADDTVIVASGDASVCIATVQAAGDWSCPVADPLPDGSVTLNTVATDVAGNQTAGTPVQIRVDSGLPVAAVIVAPADGAYVATGTPAISGTGEAGDTVRVTDADGTSVCISVVGQDGSWSCTPVQALPQGLVTLSPNTTDQQGNDIPGSPIQITIDTTAPPAARVTAPVAGAAVSSRPTISGTGEANDTVDVTDSLGADVCVGTVSTAGTWSCTASQALPTGPVTLTPTATDRAGNVTPGDPVTVTVALG
jgi:Bacterial Ig-like domain/GEVED domain